MVLTGIAAGDCCWRLLLLSYSEKCISRRKNRSGSGGGFSLDHIPVNQWRK